MFGWLRKIAVVAGQATWLTLYKRFRAQGLEPEAAILEVCDSSSVAPRFDPASLSPGN